MVQARNRGVLEQYQRIPGDRMPETVTLISSGMGFVAAVGFSVFSVTFGAGTARRQGNKSDKS